MSIPAFKNQQLLVTALTHRSAINEKLSSSQESNERLEYLGDAVLELATSEFLFKKFPHQPEGKLTAYRSALVKTETLAEVARELGLGEKLKMSRGEVKSGGRTNVSLLANTTEAVIGALYLDQGFTAVQSFLEKHLFHKVERILADKAYLDPKSWLQEKVQAKKLTAPAYQIIAESGPDHDKIFTVQVLVEGEVKGVGRGHSKQQAQREAARVAIEKYY